MSIQSPGGRLSGPTTQYARPTRVRASRAGPVTRATPYADILAFLASVVAWLVARH